MSVTETDATTGNVDPFFKFKICAEYSHCHHSFLKIFI